MTKIKQLTDRDTGGLCNESIYPMTATTAVYSKNEEGEDIADVELVLEDRLQKIEAALTTLQETVKQLASSITVITDSQIQNLLNGTP